jgi:hypothetical protein
MALSPLSQQVEQVPTPPTPPTPPGSPIITIGQGGGGTFIQIPNPGRPMSSRDVAALRARGRELSNQLQSATSRRNTLAGQLEDAGGLNKTGIEQRIALLDQRILGLERDIAYNGQLLASAPASLASETVVPRFGPMGLNPGQITGITIVGTIFVGFPIAIAFARNLWRRASRQAAPAPSPESGQRMERLEQAVDAIAIEVERISEGQRFMTRLLTEGSAPALSVGQKAAEPLRLPDREAVRASRESA